MSIGGVYMLRIAICDDDIVLCSEMESNLLDLGTKYMKKLDILIFYSGESMLKYIRDGEQFDIIFLDIELGKILGVRIGEVIRDELKDDSVQIIYISANDSYAMKLFETRPMNFLIKPIEQTKLERVFLKAVTLVNNGDEYFTYHMNQKAYRQQIKEICYFESLEKKIRMVAKGHIEEFYSRLKDVESEVSGFGFINIHKSYLINPRQIVKYEYEQLTMSNGSILPISQAKRSMTRKYLANMRKGKSI